MSGNARYLAIVLSRLDDFANACSAYEKSIEMESDHMFHLNFAITLFNHGDLKEAKRQFLLFDELSTLRGHLSTMRKKYVQTFSARNSFPKEC